jgi:DNA gyrase subunit A
VPTPASPPLNIAEEMRDSYLNYAMSVIVNRALPDVRDGLKPSQRRILVAMHDLHLGPTAATSKCASIVGETMKRYHPHGEQTIYPTLVRMAQDWNLRYRLVHSQGNFGSIAGLAPAAMRYCVTGDTLVRTLNGTRRIDQIAQAEPNSDVDLFEEVFNGQGRPVVASKLFHSGDHPTLRLRTREGFEITGTHNHPLLCPGAPPDDEPRWRVMGELRPGDPVLIIAISESGALESDPGDGTEMAFTSRLATSARVAYRVVTIASITSAGVQPVYSLRIEADCHSFITNGFISHNTEARLTAVAGEMLDDLEHETVDFQDNYDGKYREPLVLPSKFPNLLVNGSDGIAVGMATDIPPHNLREVCTSLIRLINNPEAGLLELMADNGGEDIGIQGPDFPTGGEVYNYRGLIDAYLTGRGKITLRARAHIVEEGRSSQIVITEVPFQQTRERVTLAIVDLINNDRIAGINDVRDESSERKGEPVRIVLYLKQKADPELILKQLYEFSPLQKTVSIINLALVDGKPEILPLKRMLEEFLRHRIQVIRRRTEYLLREAKRKSHILEGQLIAMSSLDEVIRIVRAAPSRADAKIHLQGLEVSAALMTRALGEAHFQTLQREIGVATSYRMTEAQAEAVVRLQLGQLANLERDEILREYQQLRTKIGEHETLLSDERNILARICKDLEELRDRYGDKRRTLITQTDLDQLNMADLIPQEQMAVTLTHNGYIKRLPLKTYRTQHRGGKGVSGGTQREDDFVEHFFTASTHDYLLCFTNQGQLYWLKVYDIPEASRTSAGRYIAQVLSLREEEKITSILAVPNFDDESAALLMATRQGIVKKTALKDYSRPKKGGIIGISLDEGDNLIGVALVRPGDEVILATRQGMAIRFDESQARAMGRNTRGVKGITLKKTDDEVVALVVADPQGSLLTVCAGGYGKRTPFGANTAGDAPETEDAEVEVAEPEEGSEETPAEGGAVNSSFRYRKQKRGGKGTISVKVSERNGPVVGVAAVQPGDQAILITSQGMVNRTHVDEIRVAGRNTQGVKIMTPREGDRIVSVVRVPPEEATDTTPTDATETPETPTTPETAETPTETPSEE